MQALLSLKFTVAIKPVGIFFGISSQHLTLQRLAFMKYNLTRHEYKLLHSGSLGSTSHLNCQIPVHLIIKSLHLRVGIHMRNSSHMIHHIIL